VSDPQDRPQAARFIADALAAGDPTGWFEPLYAATAAAGTTPPWNREDARPLVAEWLRAHAADGVGRRAVVVGCGLGADAELVGELGFATVAFDISETAVAIARSRSTHPDVAYAVGDLLDLPSDWVGAFDLVVESYTVQALPDPPRAAAIAGVARLVAPGGTLLVLAAAREEDEPADGPPWPLTRAEIASFATLGPALELARVELLPDPEAPDQRRWRAELRAPGFATR
jgi:SAM-dependent methyltransferase